MEDLLKLLVLFCLLFWDRVFSLPLDSLPRSGDIGKREHVILVNYDHPSATEDLLVHIGLNAGHRDVRHIYHNKAFRGFAANLDSKTGNTLTSIPNVLIEPVSTISRAATPSPYSTRPDGPWGLQSISTSSSVSGTPTALEYTYSFADSSLGSGSDVYILDSGIYTANQVFSNRATMLWSFDGDMSDQDGHGTHVSGTAGGDVVGVASDSNLFGLKVLDADGDGSSSDIVAAIDQVISAHETRKSSAPGFRGSVISMSLSAGGEVLALNQAVQAAISAGVHVVVAAGNFNSDACGYSPSSQGGVNGDVIVVGAVGMQSTRSSFSNYGSCVDVYAPGEEVISSWIGAPSMLNILSGTSMATPHVTGIVAYAMANDTLAGDPAMMKNWIRETALQMSDGTLVANNGVQAVGTTDGLLSILERRETPRPRSTSGS